MERSIELFAAVNFLVIGLSHMVRPKVWAEFFMRLRGWGLAGVFVNGFIGLSMGSIIVAFHNLWVGPATILTVFGWAQVIKALLNFTVPQIGMRAMGRVSPKRSGEFVGAGLVLLVLSGLCWYTALTR
jgi:hypothetical protein